MFQLAKGLQLGGIVMIGVGFVVRFPALMDPRWFVGGMVLTFCGWVLQRYLLR